MLCLNLINRLITKLIHEPIQVHFKVVVPKLLNSAQLSGICAHIMFTNRIKGALQPYSVIQYAQLRHSTDNC